MSDLTCRLIAALPNDMPLNRVLRRHRDRCLRCQADDARVVGVTRRLSTLGGEVVPAPEGLASHVITRLGPQDGSDPRRPIVTRVIVRWAATGLVLLATAVAVGAALAARMRHRPTA
ncbi:MAG: hypothetical protein A2135_01000 [Actinobacteria bacterium RBG_16_67_15]|jgi:hypothetical protein|nr:MAG: hypothetical protein A2135_01000 [Actinobacteria bacterium RBG_16_67_15]